MKVYLVQDNYREVPGVYARVFSTRELAEKFIGETALKHGYEEVIEVEVDN